LFQVGQGLRFGLWIGTALYEQVQFVGAFHVAEQLG
jgi:hypothetical protein